ncbi:hypothetical protein BH11PAT4_BH11PAT4_8000 [soil metagenome]
MTKATPDITVGFHPGASTILANFTGNFSSSSQRAVMAQCHHDEDPCCFGSIERKLFGPSIVMFGAIAADVSEASFFIEANPCTREKNFSLRATQNGGVRRLTLKYNPSIPGSTWKVIYGMILREIWQAGVKARNSAEVPATPPKFSRTW